MLFFDKFKQLCLAPFRGITPDLGQQWSEFASNSSWQRYNAKQENSSTFFTASPRTSTSRDAAESTPQDGRWYIGDDNFINKPVGENTAWQECSNMVDDHDATLCQVWREEIDTLLVFAGLFSGVLTAFIIESYKWLMEEPDDLTADYLRQMLAIMSNTTIPAVRPYSSRPSLPDNIVTLINGLWFSSLTLSLSSALIGIVSKQWLREYLRDAGRSHKTNLAVRQVKYQGLSRWYVGAIVTMIPLLLQGALFLFLVGIIYLLWQIQPVVASVISVFGMCIVLFFVVTTILPTAQFIFCRLGLLHLHTTSQFPYKSAQAWLFLQLSLLAINSVAWLSHTVASLWNDSVDRPFAAPYRKYPAWPQWDLDWTQSRDESARWSHEPTALGLCLGSMELNFEHQHLRDWLWNCLWSMRQNADNAKYVLQCVRRTPKSKANFPSAQDDLASAVLPSLDPQMASQAACELISHTLLDTKGEAHVEHIIRMYNGLVRRGVHDIPPVVCRSLRDAIHAMPRECTNGTRTQLFLVAQDILRRNQHTERYYIDLLDLISAIITYLSRAEMQEEDASAVGELSLDLSSEIMDWLERYPDPSGNWRDYKSRVLWSARTAVLLARRLASFQPLDTIAPGHPRLPSVYALFELVDTRTRMIPPGTLPLWTPEKADMTEFAQVKSSLDAACEASSEPDVDVPPGAEIHAQRHLHTPRPQGGRSMDSTGKKSQPRRSNKRTGAPQNLRWDEGLEEDGPRGPVDRSPILESDIADADIRTTSVHSSNAFPTSPSALSEPGTSQTNEGRAFNTNDYTEISDVEALDGGPSARPSPLAVEEDGLGSTSFVQVGLSRRSSQRTGSRAGGSMTQLPCESRTRDGSCTRTSGST
ncbi:hypothetical protein BD626DRAFT_163679 [Schizophyllum amplum]|uniref:DUF6535 domain-containing protein n=1 Tax=Schizophyllum amplum TaxID=97359 RepID=A0A550CPL8_9AGAR|nr:hypothetical protein BD626DRAFT_163679 [Auriculariopsis ampla]